MKYKVLITDRRHKSIAQERAVLEPLGVEIVDHFCTDEDELIQYGQGAIGLLVSYANVSRRVMEALPDLKIAVKYGVGYDNLDTAAAAELGVFTVNVPDYCVEEVALQALSLIMNGLRFGHFFGEEVRRGNWIKDPSVITMHRPSAMRMGFIGLGRIARKLAEYMKPIVSSFSFYDPFIEKAEGFQKYTSLSEMFATCGIISIHSPLTKETQNMVGKAILEKANDLVLVNTSRAAVVDRTSLIAALENGNIHFYGADVNWEEPTDMHNPENQKLLSMKNVLITPHSGWYSEESENDVRRKAALEIARVIKGERPLHVVR